MPQQNDVIKAMVAASVQHHLVNDGTAPPLHPMPRNVEKVVSFALGPNATKVKVYTYDEGVRSFTIQLREDRLVVPDEPAE